MLGETQITSEEQYQEQKLFLLEKLDETIKGLHRVKSIIEKGQLVENKDWVIAARPLHEFMNPFQRYQEYMLKLNK